MFYPIVHHSIATMPSPKRVSPKGLSPTSAVASMHPTTLAPAESDNGGRPLNVWNTGKHGQSSTISRFETKGGDPVKVRDSSLILDKD